MSYISRPVERSEAVTPSDGARFNACRGLYVGTAGDIAVVEADGRVALFRNVPSGDWSHVCIGVMATNTTAADLRALY